MIVRLQGDISGTRDGQPWPPRGPTIDLPDVEAIGLCQSGMAVPVPTDQVERAVPDDDSEQRALTTESAGALGRRKRA